MDAYFLGNGGLFPLGDGAVFPGDEGLFFLEVFFN
jgi:hypothetical protein